MIGQTLISTMLALTCATACGTDQPLDDHPARVRLVSQTKTLVAGETNFLGLAFEIDRGWHLYWNGLNDTGFAPQVKLRLPEGIKAGEIQWPVPRRYKPSEGILDHAYFDQVLLVIPLHVAVDMPTQRPISIEADVEWLVCEEACIPGDASVSVSLPVVPHGTAGDPSGDARLFDAARVRIPKPLPDPLPMWLTVRPAASSLEVRAEKAAFIAFYPYEQSQKPVDLIGEGEVRGDRLTVRFENKDDKRTGIAGVIEIRREGEQRPDVFVIDTRPKSTDKGLPRAKETGS